MSRKECTTLAPVAEGDWIADAPGMICPDIAKVRAVYWDDIAGEWVADLQMYSHIGGRRRFEPAVPMEAWQRIEKPDFPVSTDMSGFRDWGPYLNYLPAAQATSAEVGS